MPRVYLDHASAWPPRPEAVAAHADALAAAWADPSRRHLEARTAMEELYRWKPLLVGINDKLVLEVDGEPARLIPDDEGTRDEEPPMVQYLKWILTDEQVAALRRGPTNVRIGVDHPNYTVRVDTDQEFVARIAAMIG